MLLGTLDPPELRQCARGHAENVTVVTLSRVSKENGALAASRLSDGGGRGLFRAQATFGKGPDEPS